MLTHQRLAVCRSRKQASLCTSSILESVSSFTLNV